MTFAPLSKPQLIQTMNSGGCDILKLQQKILLPLGVTQVLMIFILILTTTIQAKIYPNREFWTM